jgi:methylated-DNA-protein-cysteine methyltransferase-like protein
MNSLTASVVQAIKRIPEGKVATYGQIAAMAGDPGATRLVVWALRAYSDEEKLPWHRVVNSRGRVSLGGEDGEIQRALLEREGVKFDEQGCVPLGLFQWRGDS